MSFQMSDNGIRSLARLKTLVDVATILGGFAAVCTLRLAIGIGSRIRWSTVPHGDPSHRDVAEVSSHLGKAVAGQRSLNNAQQRCSSAERIRCVSAST
jgi:hypothetical protein